MKNKSLLIVLFVLTNHAMAAGDNIVVSPKSNASAPQANPVEYWTQQRMQNAIPRDAKVILTPEQVQQSQRQRMTIPAPGTPRVHPGWSGKGTPPPPDEVVELSNDELIQMQAGALAESYGAPPSNPLSGPYGPFQRYAMHGTYRIFPRSVHGKLFFSLGGSNYVCSATVAGKSVIITAGHCISEGNGSTWATNVVFCSGYTNSSQNPFMGCYGIQSMITSSNWFNSSDPNYDYACLVANNTGSVVSNKVGVATGGWAGIALNFTDFSLNMFGYPAGAPFDGNSIQQVGSVVWYQYDFGKPTAQTSNFIGSDLTGGSSGGGWLLSWHAPGNEAADTDNSYLTDPSTPGGLSGPYITGVNSHKRCTTNCNTPPTSTTGLYWQEMSSPPFYDSSDTQDFWTIYNNSDCAQHPSNL